MTLKAACIIGAGYSFAAGLPLTSSLFDTEVSIVSDRSRKQFEAVWADYSRWQGKNPDRYLEEYLTEIYLSERSGLLFDNVPFAYIVNLISAVLASPRTKRDNQINPRYSSRLTTPSWNKSHENFWRVTTSVFSELGIITTNYDLFIERSLRHRRMKRGFGIGFHYGGIKHPQLAKGIPLPFTVTDQQRVVELKGEIPLFKLHGSLNWAVAQSGVIELFQDVRPAFREKGKAAIVPPITEKAAPSWLKPIWHEAEALLSEAQIWIVCGYSLPSYDIAMNQMLKRTSKNTKTIFILDPYSESLKSRYSDVAPDASIYCLEGLPNGVFQLAHALEQG